MCLAVPGRVLNIEDDRLRMATVSFGGVTKSVSLALVPEAGIGAYVIVHVGSLRTLSDVPRRAQALEVMARALAAPVFPTGILERERVRHVGALKEANLKPDTQVNREFYRLIYRQHPYALRGSGEVDTLGRLTRDDLVAFYRGHYVADRAVIAMMGDVTRQEAEAIAEQLTRELPRAGTGAAPVLPEVQSLEAAVTRVVAHPASQSNIMIGAPGIRRDDPDFFPLFVGNYILGGGGFVSRLTKEVREKRGYAYSVYSYFSPQRQPGPFQIGLGDHRQLPCPSQTSGDRSESR